MVTKRLGGISLLFILYLDCIVLPLFEFEINCLVIHMRDWRSLAMGRDLPPKGKPVIAPNGYFINKSGLTSIYFFLNFFLLDCTFISLQETG